MSVLWYVKGTSNTNNVEGNALGTLFAPVMEVIEQLQPDYLTAIDSMVMSARRTCGVYRLGTAEGRLEKSNVTGSKDGSGWGYRLTMRFTDINDAQKLYDQVFGGLIRPDISYEDPQTPFRIPSYLTAEEQQLALLVVRGLTNAEIANRLDHTPRQVRTNVSNLLHRCDAKNRMDLILSFLAGF